MCENDANFCAEEQRQCVVNTGFEERSFITSDPARDGTNWYAYCGNNPVNSIDPSGLENIDFETRNLMHNSKWENKVINPSGGGNGTIGEVGCYLMGFSDIVQTLKPRKLAIVNLIRLISSNFFDNTSTMNPKQAAENYGLEWDYWTRKNQGGDLAGKLMNCMN